MDIEPFVIFLSGLGLFFVGLNFLTVNLKKLTDRKLRMKIAKWTKNKYLGLLWGGIFVMTTQSSSAATMIMVGMVRAGMMQAVQTFPIIIGVNAFGGLVIFLLVLDVKLAVLFLIGVTGLIYSGSKHDKIKLLAGALFGIGILFLGIYHFQLAVEPLMARDDFNEIAGWLQNKYFISFLVGIATTMVVQSSIPPVVLIIPLAQINLITLNEAVMFVYGANVGSAVLTYIFTTKFTGKSKQVAIFQITYNLFCGIVLVPLFYIEHYLHIPMMLSFLNLISEDISMQISITFIIFNVFPGVLLIFALKPLNTWFNKVWPESIEDKYSKPKFLHAKVLRDPGTAIDLLELEQRRVIGLFQKYFELFRKKENSDEAIEIFNSLSTVSNTITETINDLTTQSGISQKDYERINELLSVQQYIYDINGTLNNIREELVIAQGNEASEQFGEAICEGLDAILMTLVNYTNDYYREDFKLLMAMTSKDGNGISTVRKQYLEQEKDLDPEQKMNLLSMANYSELLIWLFRQIVKKYKD